MARRKRPPETPGFDRELAHLAPAERMAEWRRRVCAMLFASAVPVDRAIIAEAIGRDVPVETVIEAVRDWARDGGIEVVRAGAGWMLQTRRDYAGIVRLATGPGADAQPEMTERELAVLAAIAFLQPVTRAGLEAVFGQTPGAALLERLKDRGLIAAGPRRPGRGAPHSFVTTPLFLATFGYESLEAFAEDLAEQGLGLQSGPESGRESGWPRSQGWALCDQA